MSPRLAGMASFMNAANAVTLLGACAGLASALLAIHGHLAQSLAALIVCGLCDVFDGLIARRLTRTEEQKTFGGRLDSICDAVIFGAVPPIVMHQAGMNSPAELALLAVFLCCAVWRLAYFDTVGLAGGEGPSKYYYGLPTTFIALTLPLLASAGFYNQQALRIGLNVAALGSAIAMVSPFKFPKPRGIWYVIMPAAGVGMLVTYLALAAKFPGNQPALY